MMFVYYSLFICWLLWDYQNFESIVSMLRKKNNAHGSCIVTSNWLVHTRVTSDTPVEHVLFIEHLLLGRSHNYVENMAFFVLYTCINFVLNVLYKSFATMNNLVAESMNNRWNIINITLQVAPQSCQTDDCWMTAKIKVSENFHFWHFLQHICFQECLVLFFSQAVMAIV